MCSRSKFDVAAELGKYRFYHAIDLGNGIVTPGRPSNYPTQQQTLRVLRSLDVAGKRALDIGCYDGLFSFEMEKLGATEVIAIDRQLRPAATRFLIPYLESQVRMHEMNVLDLTPATFGRFDLVCFPGVLYHLRYPFWALKLIRDVLQPGGTLVLETAVMLDCDRDSMLFCPVAGDTPYEDASSVTYFNLKGLQDTLCSLGFSVDQVAVLDNPGCLKGSGPGSWAFRLRRWRRRLFSGPRRRHITDRAVLVCRRRRQSENEGLEKYWESTNSASARREAA
jgi:SAM-dependent methyltransferase